MRYSLYTQNKTDAEFYQAYHNFKPIFMRKEREKKRKRKSRSLFIVNSYLKPHRDKLSVRKERGIL